jgi:hypothetical protein
MWSIVLRVMIAGSASLAFAAPAAADEAEYLHELQPSYLYLSPQELLSEGMKVCQVARTALPAPNIVVMVQRDLKVSVTTAGDIVAAAVVQLDC